MTDLMKMEPEDLRKRELDSHCPLCGKSEIKFRFHWSQKSFSQCKECGLVYQNPYPQSEDKAFYQHRYYGALGDIVPLIRQARLFLYEDFLNELEKYRKTGRILDIGCGHGDFLTMAKERGWECWGIEPSFEASAVASRTLGHSILNRTVEETEFPPGHFDGVTLWNVIDYLSDPVATLERIRNWISPDGILFIRTPNAAFHLSVFRFYRRFSPLLAKLGWEKDVSVFMRANFDASALRRLLAKAGFQKAEIQNGKLTTGDPYRVSSLAFWVEAAKAILYFSSAITGFLSGGTLFTGSNLTVIASNSEFTRRSQSIRVRIVFKSIAMHVLAVLGYLLGIPVWRKLLGRGHDIRILLYHSVEPFGEGDMNVPHHDFERQLRFLKKHYHVISLTEAVKALGEKKRFKRTPVVITFDDGYENNYQFAYPILKKHHLPATIFLLTGGGDRDRKTGHIEQGSYSSRLLEWEHVLEMQSSGICLGSHGESHQKLKQLSAEGLSREIYSSRDTIECKTGNRPRFFSYPYGTPEDFDERAVAIVQKAGFEAAFTAIYGMNHASVDRFAMKRIGIGASDSLFTFQAKLNGALSLLPIFSLPFLRRLIRRLDLNVFERPKRPSPILLVSVDFPPHTDGVSTISRQLSAQISETGKKMMVIGPKDYGDKEFDAQFSYKAFRVPGYEWGHARFLPIFLVMPYVVFRHGIRKIFAMNIAYGGVLSWLLSFLKPLDYLIFAYGYEFEKVKGNPFAAGLYRRIYGRAKAIVCCSQQVRQRLIQFGVLPEKTHVLYPAVDLERFCPASHPALSPEGRGKGKTPESEFPSPPPEERARVRRWTDLHGRRVLLTVGRLIERKGHDQVLRALPKVIQQFPDVLYCISGIGPTEEKLRELTRKLGLQEHVRFLGKVPDAELPLLYNACEIFVMPSREIAKGGHIEGFGIVFLEANACGKPVIGGRSGGVSEAIRDGETGLLVNPESPDDIAEKILFFLSNPDKAKEFGQKGLKWVRETFQWEFYVREAYRFLNDEALK